MAHKLLLADDSVTIQRVIELTFADEDVEVTTVGDGQLAIERLDVDPPDIILADIDMPKRDGYEVAAYVKSRPKLAHIPVVLLTGAFEPIDQARAAAAGSSDVLAKPFEPQMVINRVKELLGKKRQEEVPEFTAPEPPQASQPQAPTPPISRQKQPESAHPVSLDDYFDQLDAAFSNLQPASAQADAAAGELDWSVVSTPAEDEKPDERPAVPLAAAEKRVTPAPVAPPPVAAPIAPAPVASAPKPFSPPSPLSPVSSPGFVPSMPGPAAVKPAAAVTPFPPPPDRSPFAPYATSAPIAPRASSSFDLVQSATVETKDKAADQAVEPDAAPQSPIATAFAAAAAAVDKAVERPAFTPTSQTASASAPSAVADKSSFAASAAATFAPASQTVSTSAGGAATVDKTADKAVDKPMGASAPIAPVMPASAESEMPRVEPFVAPVASEPAWVPPTVPHPPAKPAAPVVPAGSSASSAPVAHIAPNAPIAPDAPIAPNAPIASSPFNPQPKVSTNPFANLATAKAEAAARPVITEEVIEEIVSRVLSRLSDKVVRETVTEIVSQTAERLVQEEIDRIKAES